MNLDQIEQRAKDGKADPEETLALIDELRRLTDVTMNQGQTITMFRETVRELVERVVKD